ncbi:MAG: AI-2E family transporter [Bacteroidota bacterium]
MKLSRGYITLIAGLLLAAVFTYFFSQIVLWVIISWILAMIGQPLMRFFQKYIRFGKKFRAGPNLSAMLTLLTYFVVLGALVMLFVPLIIQQINNLSEIDYPALATTLEEPILQINQQLIEWGFIDETRPPEEQLRDALPVNSWFQINKLGDLFSGILSTAGNLVITLFTLVFITFFFLREDGLLVGFLTALVPNQYEEQVRNAIDSISHMLTRYFGGILVQITVITLFVWIGLSIFGIKNALVIGFFAALINVIPYVGPIIGAAFGLFITISSNLDLSFYAELFPMLLQVVSVFAAMQMLDNFILQPWIFSTSVKAHPLEIFLVVLMGAQVNGIVGMVAAIPTYTVLRVIAAVFLSEFKIVQHMTEGMTDHEEDE